MSPASIVNSFLVNSPLAIFRNPGEKVLYIRIAAYAVPF